MDTLEFTTEAERLAVREQYLRIHDALRYSVPERVWVRLDEATGQPGGVATSVFYAPSGRITQAPYVPESRLREVERELSAALQRAELFGSDIDRLRAEREALKLQVQFAHELAEDKVEAMREQLAALRAELTQRERAAFEAGYRAARPIKTVDNAFAAYLKRRG